MRHNMKVYPPIFVQTPEDALQLVVEKENLVFSDYSNNLHVGHRPTAGQFSFPLLLIVKSISSILFSYIAAEIENLNLNSSSTIGEARSLQISYVLCCAVPLYLVSRKNPIS